MKGSHRNILLTTLLLFAGAFLHLQAEPKAWEKPYPKDKADLLAIQNRVLKILPKAKQAVVALEDGGGAGSGVIVSEDGLVLTAAHVIGRPNKRITVRLPNGKRLKAISLGGSQISDAGMVRITEEGNFTAVPLAPAGSSEIGNWCIALGHPGGFDSKRGIVTRLGRVIAKKGETIRTDGRLLGGDSGGPLFDLDGRVIGIHSRIASKDDQNFHVTIESFHANRKAFEAGEFLTDERRRKGGFLGVACEETDEGLLIREVVEDSAALKAGIRSGDVLLAIDDEPIDTREELIFNLTAHKPGEIVVILLRRDDKELSLRATLGRYGSPPDDEEEDE